MADSEYIIKLTPTCTFLMPKVILQSKMVRQTLWMSFCFVRNCSCHIQLLCSCVWPFCDLPSYSCIQGMKTSSVNHLLYTLLNCKASMSFTIYIITILSLVVCRLMQGWLFVYDPGFWQQAQAKALLTSVPQVIVVVFCVNSILRYDVCVNYNYTCKKNGRNYMIM